MVKADGSVLVHADGGSYKPLNWMSPPRRRTTPIPVASEAVGRGEGAFTSGHAPPGALRAPLESII